MDELLKKLMAAFGGGQPPPPPAVPTFAGNPWDNPVLAGTPPPPPPPRPPVPSPMPTPAGAIPGAPSIADDNLQKALQMILAKQAVAKGTGNPSPGGFGR